MSYFVLYAPVELCGLFQVVLCNAPVELCGLFCAM